MAEAQAEALRKEMVRIFSLFCNRLFLMKYFEQQFNFDFEKNVTY
jgi:hypothetical protein